MNAEAAKQWETFLNATISNVEKSPSLNINGIVYHFDFKVTNFGDCRVDNDGVIYIDVDPTVENYKKKELLFECEYVEIENELGYRGEKKIPNRYGLDDSGYVVFSKINTPEKWYSKNIYGRYETDLISLNFIGLQNGNISDNCYDYYLVDGDEFKFTPGIDHEGKLCFIGNEGNYWKKSYIDYDKTKEAYSKAVYHEYIESNAWKARRKQYLISVGLKCEICGSAMNLNTHHIRYDNLGCEKDDDLAALCRPCHEKVHVKDIQKKT